MTLSHSPFVGYSVFHTYTRNYLFTFPRALSLFYQIEVSTLHSRDCTAKYTISIASRQAIRNRLQQIKSNEFNVFDGTLYCEYTHSEIDAN